MKKVEDMDFKELVKLLANKFKKEYYDDKGKTEEDFKKYLINFEKEYNIYLRNKRQEIPVLVDTFNNLIDDIFETDDFKNSIVGTQMKLTEELLKVSNGKQANLFKEIQEFQNVSFSETVERAFIFGYATAVQLREDLKKYTKNKISE